MLLEDKVAVIYGAGGQVGRHSTGAREGARVFLAGRSLASLERVAADIPGAAVAELNALDAGAIDRHADEVAATAGSIDISFNLISHDFVQGTPLVEMEAEDNVGPVQSTVRSTFLTTRAAARHMISRRSGVILMFGGAADPARGAHLGSLQVALHVVEAMRRQLAVELGEYGVRVVTLLTSGIPETIPERVPARQAIADSIGRSTLLGRPATLEDVGSGRRSRRRTARARSPARASTSAPARSSTSVLAAGQPAEYRGRR
jgi:NAD(P)-dependent dehydrogenase (short-subunit alcohol dehydrogenase family)